MDILFTLMRSGAEPGALVYDYVFLLSTKKWTRWLSLIEPTSADSLVLNKSFAEIMIPTQDSVRNTYLLDLLLPMDKHCLMVGDTGIRSRYEVDNMSTVPVRLSDSSLTLR